MRYIKGRITSSTEKVKKSPNWNWNKDDDDFPEEYYQEVKIDWNKLGKNAKTINSILGMINPTRFSYLMTDKKHEKFVTLNAESLKELKDLIYGKLITGEGGFGQSDGIITFTQFITGQQTTYLQIRKLSTRPQGGFFPYHTMESPIMLSFPLFVSYRNQILVLNVRPLYNISK